jgi:hypothetical protein
MSSDQREDPGSKGTPLRWFIGVAHLPGPSPLQRAFAGAAAM